MERIGDLPARELLYRIERCKARLSGIMPMGIMTRDRCETAMSQYMEELEKRNDNHIRLV